MKAAYCAIKPAECHDWLSMTDLVRLTTEAYRRARQDCSPPRGQKFLSGGVPWSSPSDFAETLTRLMCLHVQTRAHLAGIHGNSYAPEQLARWYDQTPTSDDNSPLPGAGRSPAIKGHGCPASLAGGPGCETDQGVQGPCTPTAVISSKENHS